MKVKKELLLDLGVLDDPIEDRIVGKSRWSDRHEVIFPMDGKFYRAYYSVGSSEMQDERPWEYEKEVEITEVHKVPKTIEVWEPVE